MRRNLWISSAAIGLLGLMMVFGSACGRHHGYHGHHGSKMFHGDEEIDIEHVRHGARWMLRSADPTDEQLDEIAGIAKGALEELRTLRGDRDARRAEMTAALSGTTVDRDALERLRSDTLTRMEEGSKQALDAFVRVAEVLTPEQRATLIERHEKRRGHWGRRH